MTRINYERLLTALENLETLGDLEISAFDHRSASRLLSLAIDKLKTIKRTEPIEQNNPSQKQQ